MSYETKMLREECHAAEENFVAEATYRRRRSLRANAFLLLGSASWERKVCREAFFLVCGKGIIEGFFLVIFAGATGKGLLRAFSRENWQEWKRK